MPQTADAVRGESRESAAAPAVVPAPHAQSAEEVLESLAVSVEAGLSAAEARARLLEYGPNQLRARRRIEAITILIRQVESPIVLLLAGAAAISFVFGDWLEGGAIGVVLLLNTAIGYLTEIRAVRSMEALRRLGARVARLRRDGKVRMLPAEEVVPGDVVLLEAGDTVPADLRIVQSANLAADESALTGESVPDDKSVEEVPDDTPLAERSSMLFKGTAVTRGTATAVATGTGLATELGRITALVEEVADDQSPLERRLEKLSRRLIWVTLLLAAAIIAIGFATGRDLVLIAKSGIALAVAAIPEGLPIVATLVLARGMLRMARRSALVERLSAVETLGATTMILTDKTGTLTENRMTVDRLVTPTATYRFDPDLGIVRARAPTALDDAPDLEEALRAGVLCSNATLSAETGEATGDPTEVALLLAAREAGLPPDRLSQEFPRVAEAAFDTESKRMATTHSVPEGERLVAVKGAPEAVLPLCTRATTPTGDEALTEEARREWLDRAEALAVEGYRILALATKRAAGSDDPYADLVLAGLAVLHDPPRGDIKAAIEACRDAGIGVVMVTGDHIQTARTIAQAVGLAAPDAAALGGGEIGPSPDEKRSEELAATPVFARVTPEQKLDLIRLHQARGEIVAMTGDGVNDAPALRQADIGIAMGLRGTQVAREAADIILTDDAFTTIVAAVREGRVIFGNIRRFTLYLLSCNLSEILVVGLAILIGLPLPLLPLQILFLNLVTDVFPAFALGLGEGSDDVLREPPRDPREGVLARRQWLMIVAYGSAITASVLGALLLAEHALGATPAEAVTVSFLTLALAQLWHVFNMRDLHDPLWRNDVVRNVFVWPALGICGVLLAAALKVPLLAAALEVVPISSEAWLLVSAASLVPLVLSEIARAALTLHRGLRRGHENGATSRWQTGRPR